MEMSTLLITWSQKMAGYKAETDKSSVTEGD